MHELDLINLELPLHIELTRKEPGCLTFDVTQDETDSTKFEVYEEFVDQAAFEYHQQRVKSSTWGQVTINVERHYKITNTAEPM